MQEANSSDKPSVHQQRSSPFWVWSSFLITWIAGAVGVGLGMKTGVLPTHHGIEVSELLVGAICYGLFIALIIGMVVHAVLRKGRPLRVMIIGVLFGAVTGAGLGYAVVHEFFGAVWVGLGGALFAGLLAARRAP